MYRSALRSFLSVAQVGSTWVVVTVRDVDIDDDDGCCGRALSMSTTTGSRQGAALLAKTCTQVDVQVAIHVDMQVAVDVAVQ